MAGAKVLQVGRSVEQRGQMGRAAVALGVSEGAHQGAHIVRRPQAFRRVGGVFVAGFGQGQRVQGRASGHEKFRMVGKNGLAFILVQGQRIHKTLTQCGQKGQRSPQEGHLALDVAAELLTLAG